MLPFRESSLSAGISRIIVAYEEDLIGIAEKENTCIILFCHIIFPSLNMVKLRPGVWIAALLFLPLTVMGQRIEGLVLRKDVGSPLKGVKIYLNGTLEETETAKDGSFTLKDLPLGVHEVCFEYPFMEKKCTDVVIKKKRRYSLGLSLQPRTTDLANNTSKSYPTASNNNFRMPAALYGIDRSMLLQYSPRTVPEVLLGMPGTWWLNNHYGGASPVIRGMRGNQILTLVDGVPINNATFSGDISPWMGLIDPFSIEQLDIQRGSWSTQYGSDAMGGAIHIHTRDPKYVSEGFRVHSNAYARYMSNRADLKGMERTARGEIILGSPNFALLGGISIRDFGDLSTANNETLIPHTGYKALSGDLKLKVRAGNRNELTLSYQTYQQEDVPFHLPLQTGIYQSYHAPERDRSLAYAKFNHQGSGKWLKELRVVASFQQTDDQIDRISQQNNLNLSNRDEVESLGAKIEIISQPSQYWKAVSGISYSQDQVFSEVTDNNRLGPTSIMGNFPDEATSESVSLYSMHTVDILKLRVSMGGRAQAYTIKAINQVLGDLEIQPQALSGYISASLPIHRDHNLFASLSTGFRAPNFSDIRRWGIFENTLEVPNDSLSPEQSVTTEIGFKSKTDAFTGSLIFFRTQLNQLIQRRPGVYLGNPVWQGFPVFTQDNLNQASVHGFEAELEIPLAKALALYGNLNYTFGDDVSTQQPLSYIPPLNGKLGLFFQDKEGFWGRAEWLYASSQDRLSFTDQLNPSIAAGGTPGWNIVNLLAGYNFQFFSFAAGIQNLFNTEYRLHGSSLDGYGFSFWVNFRLKV